MMGQHGSGTGPFRVKTRQGRVRWRVAVTMGDGRRVWRQFPTYRAAEAGRRQLVEQRELDLDPTRQTVEGFLRSWIESLRDAKNRRVRPRTLAHYELVVERHIVPALGSVQLVRLSASRIQDWIDRDSSAPRTVHHHHAVLRRALNIAVRQRLLAYNPANAVELPTVRATTGDPLTVEEARALLEATRGDRLHALWRLAIVTGLRQGELLGLTWEDVGDGSIAVNHQLQRLDGAWVRTSTKAARRLERVSIDAETAAVLAEHRLRMAAERKPGDEWFGMVFLTSTGKPMHQAEVLKAWHSACDKAGIRRRRFHDIRHGSAHMMADLGVAEDVRMNRQGHSTTRMARLYSGSSERQDREAVERLARALER